MEFNALGPLEVICDGMRVEIRSAPVRRLLAVLLCHAGHPVSPRRLFEAVWPDGAPDTARRTLQVYVHRLRHALGAGRVELGAGGGYQLVVEPGEVDVRRFTELLHQGRAARRAGQPDRARHLLREGLDLWRGDPYADLAAGPLVAAEAHRLTEERQLAYEEFAGATLDLGRPDEVIADLDSLARSHPYRERPRALLMLALYRAGRQADALEVFRRTRTLFVNDLGIEPGAMLRRLHEAMLRGDPALTTIPSDRLDEIAPPEPQPEFSSAGAAVRDPVPRLLPPDLAGFVGRERELRALNKLLSGRAAEPATIAVITGTAGVGKTTLAVRWAHQVAGGFPGGQLYVNLRGFDPAGRVMAPAEALQGFLEVLGVVPERMPVSLDARVALYRSRLAGKRVLVVLDNAFDADQVRPLLPGTADAVTVVTSRNRLTPLVATAGAHPLALDLLSTAEARELLSRRLGADRIAAEAEAVDGIIGACAHLPLALAVAAARVQQAPFPLTALLAELKAGRLDALDAGDASSHVRAVLSWSYTALNPPAARLFRLLGLHPGPAFSATAAASLAGLPPVDTRRLLAELTRANVLAERAPGRFAFHDLLRVFAAELTHHDDPDDARHAALTRMLDHYTHTAHIAERLFNPNRRPTPLPLAPAAHEAWPEPIADRDAAIAWLTAEQPVLLAALRQAADFEFDAHTWQLAWNLNSFLDWRGSRPDLAECWRIAVTAAQRLGHPAAEACAHGFLASTEAALGRFTLAHTHLRQALDLSTKADDRIGQAVTHHLLSLVYEQQGDSRRALQHALCALELHQAAGYRDGQARALNAVGWCHARLGDHAQAIEHCQRALTLLDQLGNRYGQARAWDSLGYAHSRAGDHAQAIDCYQHALALSRDLGDRQNEANILVRLGDVQHAAGDSEAACATWQEALNLLVRLDDPDAASVRAKLHRRNGVIDGSRARTRGRHPST